jgi:hypothetical protein
MVDRTGASIAGTGASVRAVVPELWGETYIAPRLEPPDPMTPAPEICSLEDRASASIAGTGASVRAVVPELWGDTYVAPRLGPPDPKHITLNTNNTKPLYPIH